MGEAPGCLHYLGNYGQVRDSLHLSSAVDRTVQVAASLRKDSSLRFFAAHTMERKRTTLLNLHYKREDRWANYIKAAVSVFNDGKHLLRGVNITIFGNIPRHLQLAYPQAMELAAALALRRLSYPHMRDVELLPLLSAAHTAFYETENKTVEFLCMMNAKKDHFLLIDEGKLEVTRLRNSFTKHKIVLFDSRVPLIDAESELRLRRRDVSKGLMELATRKRGTSFRSYDESDLDDLLGALNEEVRRRCLFVVQEIARIKDAWKAIEDKDTATFASAIFHSHEGLSDMYDVSCPETDWLVKRALETPGIMGARLTGRGFGGCVYAFIEESALAAYHKRFEDYERIFGFRPVAHEIHPASPSKLYT
jgi:galactokinase